MSQLIPILTHKLKTEGHLNFLGSDGFTVNAHDLHGVYSLEVVNEKGVPVLNCFSDLNRIMNQVSNHA